jgi:hypothetical protein
LAQSIQAADPGALHTIICNRVPCNTALADHPTILVDVNSMTQPETFSVGMLGIINGILERTTGHRVAAKFSDGEQPVLLGCVEYAPAPTEQSSVTPAKHHDPRLAQAKVGLETWGLRRGAYIVTDNHYLTKSGTWTFGVQDENNRWPDLTSAKAFLLCERDGKQHN